MGRVGESEIDENRRVQRMGSVVEGVVRGMMDQGIARGGKGRGEEGGWETWQRWPARCAVADTHEGSPDSTTHSKTLLGISMHLLPASCWYSPST